MALIATITLEIDDNGHATGEPRRFRLKATPTPEATQRALLERDCFRLKHIRRC